MNSKAEYNTCAHVYIRERHGRCKVAIVVVLQQFQQVYGREDCMFSTLYARRQRFHELMHLWCPLDYIKPVYFGLNISFMTGMNSYSLKYDIISLFLLKLYFIIV